MITTCKIPCGSIQKGSRTLFSQGHGRFCHGKRAPEVEGTVMYRHKAPSDSRFIVSFFQRRIQLVKV